MRDGKRATAWVRLREAAVLAARKGDTSRQDQAEHGAQKLESALPRLLVHSVEQPPPVGLTVRRDGTSSVAASLDVAIPVDPGVHRIEAEAPGRKPWSVAVSIPTAPRTTTVDVPQLDLESKPPAGPVAVSRAAEAMHKKENASDTQEAPTHASHAVPIVAGAFALAGVGVGTVFGLLARSSWSDVDQVCPARTCPDVATQSAISGKRDTANAQANVSTGAFIVAGVAAAVGVVSYLLETSTDHPRLPRAAFASSATMRW